MRAVPFAVFIVCSPEILAQVPVAPGWRFVIWATLAFVLFAWGLRDLQHRFSYM